MALMTLRTIDFQNNEKTALSFAFLLSVSLPNIVNYSPNVTLLVKRNFVKKDLCRKI